MKSNRTRLVFANLSLAMALNIVTFIFGMISSRILLEVYGSQMNGLIASINQFIAYINLVELGLSGTAVYALYKPIADNDYSEINSILSATKQYYLKAGYLFLSLVFVLSCVYPLISNDLQLSKLEVAYLVLVQGAAGIINFFLSAKYRVFLIAKQLQYVITSLSIFAVILNTSLIYIFAYVLKVDIITLRTVCILTSLMPAITILLYTHIKFKELKFQSVAPKVGALKNRYVLFVNEIAGNIHFGSPIVIITFIVNLLEVSVFSIYNTICNGISCVLNAIVVPVAASFGSLIAENNMTSFKRVYNEFEAPFYILSSTLFAIAYFAIMPFMQIYTNGINDTNYLREDFLLLMVINMFVVNLYNPQAILVRATGMFKEVQKQTIIQALITISLGVVLTYYWGINGIVVSSIVANIYRTVAMIRIYDNRLEGVESKSTFGKIIVSILNFIIIVVVCKALCLFVPGYSVTTFYSWFLYCVVIGVIAVIIAAINLFVFYHSTTISLYNRIKK